MPRLRYLLYPGLIGYAIFCYLLAPASVLHLAWVNVLWMLAPLVLLPLAFYVDRRPLPIYAWAASTGLLAGAFLLPPGLAAALLALPYLLFTVYTGWTALDRLTTWRTAEVVRLAGWLYLSVAAFWAFADRLDWQPLGFDPVIVLLTAAHFHYAGLLLPLLTGLVIQDRPSRLAGAIGWLVVGGVPLVAIGLTASQFGVPHWLEQLAVVVMIAGGMGSAYLHLIVAGYGPHRNARKLFFLGSACLLSGMLLALAYNFRALLPWPFLDIPHMYALHGTLNTIGVGVLLLGGWVLRVRSSDYHVTTASVPEAQIST